MNSVVKKGITILAVCAACVMLLLGIAAVLHLLYPDLVMVVFKNHEALSGQAQSLEAQQKWADAESKYRKAVEAGSTSALNALGCMAAEKGDYSAAYVFFSKASAAGNPKGSYNLAKCYAEGKGVRNDPIKAKGLLQQASGESIPEAMVALGLMHLGASGIQSDEIKAQELFLRAANLGSDEAMGELGRLLLSGSSLVRDPQQAIGWLEKAVALENPKAMNDLGVAYSRGLGVPQDKERARELFLRSAEFGNESAMRNQKLAAEAVTPYQAAPEKTGGFESDKSQ
jgi:TPR repeat protein